MRLLVRRGSTRFISLAYHFKTFGRTTTFITAMTFIVKRAVKKLIEVVTYVQVEKYSTQYH